MSRVKMVAAVLQLRPRWWRYILCNPFRTAVPFEGETTPVTSSLSPTRDCSPKTIDGWGRQNIKLLLLREGGHIKYHGRTYGTPEYLYTFYFLLTIFGPITNGPP